MDPRIQVKLDKYQKCGNIISQTSLLSSYTGSETDADSDSIYTIGRGARNISIKKWERGTSTKGQIWPPLEPKTESCFFTNFTQLVY